LARRAGPKATDENRRASVGRALRAEREQQRIGVRELARRVDVSPSLISQIELGRALPSVGTLYAIANELGMSVDRLLFDDAATRQRDHNGAADTPTSVADVHRDESESAQLRSVVRADKGSAIQLASGVRWERMTSGPDQGVEFLHVTYDVGGESAPADALARHTGEEYGYVLEGRLGVTVGFDTYELEVGDAIAFASTMPHRLFNAGDAVARAVWFVLGRAGDPRVVRAAESTVSGTGDGTA
jgi:transcriptional regulator with XRE-family HTH domain